MSQEVITILVLIALIAILVWILGSVIADKNKVISGLRESVRVYTERGDKWHNEYFTLRQSEAIKDGYVIMLTTDTYDSDNIFKMPVENKALK